MIKALYVALGGAVGALLRYGVGLLLPGTDGSTFPWSTFFVNLLGCLVIGLIWKLSGGNHPVLMPLVIIGILGGFTTFSSFGLDAFKLIEAGNISMAAIYMLGSTISGVLAVIIGVKLVQA